MDAHGKARYGCGAVLPGSAVHLPLRSRSDRAGGSERHLQGAGAALGDLAEGLVVGVRHIDIAIRICRHGVGIIEPRRAARAIVAAKASIRGSGEGRHDPGGGDHADGAVAGIRHIEIAAAIDSNVGGGIKFRGGDRPVETALETGRSGEGRHDPGGRDHGDGVVAAIRHIDIPSAIIHRHAGGGGKAGGKGGHRAARRDPTDGLVAGVCHKDIADGIHRDARGIVKLRIAANAVEAAGGARASGEGVNDSCGRDLADSMVG